MQSEGQSLDSSERKIVLVAVFWMEPIVHPWRGNFVRLSAKGFSTVVFFPIVTKHQYINHDDASIVRAKMSTTETTKKLPKHLNG